MNLIIALVIMGTMGYFASTDKIRKWSGSKFAFIFGGIAYIAAMGALLT